MSQEDALPEIKRVENLWFPDADLVLRAEDTLFRVHSSILGARSSVFRDMVAFPQPQAPEGDTVDGRPVVLLHDSAAEVEAFLRAVFDSSFFMPPPCPTDFYTVIGIMRLAHKYDVQYLFRRALSHLDSMYPSNFSQFLRVNCGNAAHHIDFVGGDVTEDLIALRAASQVGATWILPTAYYSVCAHRMKDVLAFGERHWKALGADAQQTCFMGQPELLRATYLVHGFLVDISEKCTSASTCREILAEGRILLLEWTTSGRRDLDPLKGWVLDERESELCGACLRDARASHGAAQRIFWDRMPYIFGLPGWDELRQMEADMVGEDDYLLYA
ncbi:hypothetical protein C8R44DRAFT_629550 [Mycena epipterygia]|nr:hypothetical protein C8R44DRAFT_629550 [Mycena epipterygia]